MEPVRSNKKFLGKKVQRFVSQINKSTSISFFQKEIGIYCVIKKDLTEYESNVFPSSAPVTHDIYPNPDPHEVTIADINIFEKEVMPIVDSIQKQFGEDKILSLDKICLAVGGNDEDYVSIDESDLLSMDVEPSLQGLLEFIQSHKDGIAGFCNRDFQPDKGNLIFFESNLRNLDKNIKSISISIISSLQQRGLFMQKHHRYYGLQLYTIIKSDELNDELLKLLKNLGIDWELLFLRRDLALEDWTEIECERRSINLKGYLKAKYETLGFFDINNITRLVVRNQLSFKIADKIAELLNRSKLFREQGFFSGDKNEPVNKAEIAAAAELACAYFGESNIKLKFDKDIPLEEIQHYRDELIKI